MVKLADWTFKERRESYAELNILGRRKLVPLLIGPDGEDALLGLTTLELFELKVDLLVQRLEPSTWIEYPMLG